ncbi:hypothetical protein B0H66DRAFT_534622 [Apodospora peruviana]|uniref:Flavin-nucleotide-binding protein n=1 Tax=Apodospora peruviana TaxID=516989 RepID=A0AAE0M2H5_9PEZI|nr:hypothetical protein B0H66DRAFT_534622 [Apodospora peruviana]
MPRQELEYPKEPFSTVKRLNDRGRYNLETIHGIINSCPMLHVSFQDPISPFPVVLPMIGQMGSFERPSAGLGDVLDLYLHGYVSSRLMNLARQYPSSTSSPDTPAPPSGLPLTISATHIDGLVLSLTPNSHSYNYRSAILFGHAIPVTSVPEKLWAMELITESIVPGRWAGSRVPPNAAEMQSTSILRVRIATGSAKIRTGTPHDDRHDLDDKMLLERVWTGVVPAYQVLGEPVAGPYNKVEKVPGYLEEYRLDRNGDNRQWAEVDAIKEPESKAK